MTRCSRLARLVSALALALPLLFPISISAQQPRAERVTAGGNPVQGVTPIRPALSAEGGSVEVNLRIRDAGPVLIHHPPGNAAGGCGLLG